VVKWIGVMTDVDDLKKIAENLQFAKLTAENANAMKSSFLSNMSHELRKPLTAIIGSAQLGMVSGKAGGDAVAGFSTVLRNGNHMLALVDDILDISKIEAGKLQLECLPVVLSHFLAVLNETLQPQALSKGLELRFETCGTLPLRFESDPTRLRQILLNLLANGLKFTEKGRVTCRVQVVDSGLNKEPLQLRFDIIDTGSGIAAHQFSNLFVPFAQGDVSTSRVYGGSGLGLAISRQLARALGGDVWLVKSEMGKGSTFAFTLPLGRSPSLLSSLVASTGEEGTSKVL
jgi:signal transduction histidine kinase